MPMPRDNGRKCVSLQMAAWIMSKVSAANNTLQAAQQCTAQHIKFNKVAPLQSLIFRCFQSISCFHSNATNRNCKETPNEMLNFFCCVYELVKCQSFLFSPWTQLDEVKMDAKENLDIYLDTFLEIGEFFLHSPSNEFDWSG